MPLQKLQSFFFFLKPVRAVAFFFFRKQGVWLIQATVVAIVTSAAQGQLDEADVIDYGDVRAERNGGRGIASDSLCPSGSQGRGKYLLISRRKYFSIAGVFCCVSKHRGWSVIVCCWCYSLKAQRGTFRGIHWKKMKENIDTKVLCFLRGYNMHLYWHKFPRGGGHVGFFVIGIKWRV